MKDTFYFQHDYNARNDPKLQDMLIDLGVEGIGVFWCIIEQLYEQGGKLPLRSCKSIAFALHVDCNKVESLVHDYGLFKNDGVNMWSDSVLKRLDKRKDISDKRKQAAIARWKQSLENQAIQPQSANNKQITTDSNVMQMQNTSNANAGHKEKEIKGNIKENIKEKSVTRFSPPTIEEIKAYILEKGYTIDAERFFDFYESKGWFVGKNKMKDWKAAIRNWAKSEKERRSTYPSKVQTIKANDEWK